LLLPRNDRLRGSGSKSVNARSIFNNGFGKQERRIAEVKPKRDAAFSPDMKVLLLRKAESWGQLQSA